MEKTTNSLYYSRTETEQFIVIVWKPFSTYSTLALLAVALIGLLCSITVLSLIAFVLLIINAIVYSADCKKPKNEINEASRKSSVQVSGNKFSFSSPLTITIIKDGQSVDLGQDVLETPKRGGYMKKIIFGFLTALFLILGIFVFSTLMQGIRQRAYIVSLVILLVLALVFFLLAYLCFRALKK